MRFFCTYFDRHYLVKGLTMIESLRRTQTSEFRIFVICIDELSRVILQRLGVPEIVLVPLHAIEHRDFDLLAAKKNRKFVGYLWTLTPVIILRILHEYPEIDSLFYVDADLFFYSSIDPLIKEMGSKDVLIHEHRFPPSWRYLEAHGKYNVGLLCFKNTNNGRSVASWWKDRCIEWCDIEIKDGKLGDQSYLNDWPERFPCVAVTENIGVGVAPWNHDQYIFGIRDRVLFADNTPVVFYHFHSFTFISRDFIHPVLHDPYTLPQSVQDYFVMPYITALRDSTCRIDEELPSFHFGLEEGSEKFNVSRPFLITQDLKEHLDKQGFSFDYKLVSPLWWRVN